MSTQSSARLTALMREKEVSVRYLADLAGVSDTAVRKWMNKGDVPRGDKLAKVCLALGVTPAYLVFGDETAPGQTVALDDGTIAVPYLDIQASCGYGVEEQHRASLVRFVRLNPEAVAADAGRIHTSRLNIITAVGDSMEPTIKSGTAVVVDTTPVEFPQDGLYAVAFNHHIFIKRVQNLNGFYRLKSDNPAYDPIDVTAFDEIKIIGRCYLGLQVMRYF